MSTVLAEPTNKELNELIDSKFREFREGSIVKGTILEIRPQVVLVDVGYKSEGAIPSNEFEPIQADNLGNRQRVSGNDPALIACDGSLA